MLSYTDYQFLPSTSIQITLIFIDFLSILLSCFCDKEEKNTMDPAYLKKIEMNPEYSFKIQKNSPSPLFQKLAIIVL